MIMLEKLKKLNPNIKFYSIYDSEFASYGKVIENLDVEALTAAAKTIDFPESGSRYKASEEKFEALPFAKVIENDFFGGVPAQSGYCWGYNSAMNATEWHTSSEINVAITEMVLLLGHVWDVKDNSIDSSKLVAFYMPKGSAIECFATTLHYCPCQTADSGFMSYVGLPKDTNTEIAHDNKNPLLRAKNKWLLAHKDSKEYKNGAVLGVTGENLVIKY